MAASGGNNMWALLADNDPGDSEEAAAMASRRLDVVGEAKDKPQQLARSGGVETESSGVVIGGGAPKHGRKDKKTSNRKQQQTAVANGEHRNQKEMTKGPAPAPAMSTEWEAYDDGSTEWEAYDDGSSGGYSSDQSGSDHEDDDGAAGGSCCRRLIRGLFRTAVLMVAIAVVLKSAGTAGRPT